MDYVALKSELENDPALLGYGPFIAAGNHTGLAALLNAPKVGVVVGRGVVPAHEVVDAIVPGEYASLVAAERDYLLMVVAGGTVNLGDGQTRAALKVLFGAGTVTRANLIALADRTGSRAEELGFGEVSEADVVAALRL